MKYFSSSTDKEFIKDQKNNPLSYEYTIIGIFFSSKEALLHEIELHNTYNVRINKRFYNKAKQTSSGFDRLGVRDSEKQLILKRKYASGMNNPMYGKHHTEHTKEILRKLFTGRRLSPETIQKVIDNHADTSGKNNGMWDKCRLVEQYDLYHNLIRTAKVKDFVIEYGYKTSSISSCCSMRKNYKTYKGFIWKFVDDKNFIWPDLSSRLNEDGSFNKYHKK